jgi:hypothetical protein
MVNATQQHTTKVGRNELEGDGEDEVETVHTAGAAAAS